MDLSEEDRRAVLGEAITPPLYYKMGDYEYNTQSKERILSGINRLDELIKGFELGCITIWTGIGDNVPCQSLCFEILVPYAVR